MLCGLNSGGVTMAAEPSGIQGASRMILCRYMLLFAFVSEKVDGERKKKFCTISYYTGRGGYLYYSPISRVFKRLNSRVCIMYIMYIMLHYIRTKTIVGIRENIKKMSIDHG